MTDDIIIRKSVNSLTNQEKKDFIEAVLALKAKPGNLADNKYDEFVVWHAKTMSTAAGTDSDFSMRNLAHAGPIFLPWHREFLSRFEQALRDEVPGVFIPYWNWEEDAESDDPKESAVWKEDFMGGDGDPNDDDIVKNGPFKDWVTVELDQHTGEVLGNSVLRRTLGRGFSDILPNQKNVYNMLKYDFYDTANWDRNSRGFRNALEGWHVPDLGEYGHNTVHLWVGGSMELSTSPNDPVFFLNHCNVDRIWSIWQSLQVIEQYPSDIRDSNNNPIGYYNLDDVFYYPDPQNKPPNARTIRMVLNHSKLNYIYDASAVSKPTKPSQ